MAKSRKAVATMKADSDVAEKKATFLRWLAEGWSVFKSAHEAGVSRTSAFRWKADDPQFAAAWDEAMEAGIHVLEDAARKRAVDGVRKPVFHKGDIVGHVREYSDSLLTLMLRGKMANVYNTDRVEHTGPGGGAVEHKITVEFVKAPKRRKDDA